MATLREGLPALYRTLFPAFFDRPAPEETKATCASCAMVEENCGTPVPSVDGESRFFRPETKCCTYHPRLPNFLVGALLADDDPALAEGRARVRAKIASRVGITPQWVRAPAKYGFLYDHAHRAFGRTASLRCPYYGEDGGTCTIWKHREAVCSTFFCKYSAGEDGRKFWMSLKTYLALVEIQLSRWVLLQLMPKYVTSGKDREPTSTPPLTARDIDDAPPDERAYRELWGEWVGREEEFYNRAFGVLRGLTPEKFEALLGLDGTIYLAMVEDAWQRANSPHFPVKLRFNPKATVQWLPGGAVAMGAYSDNDALALPGEAYHLLTDLTGRQPVDEVRGRWRAEKQADLDDTVLLELYRHRILTEP